MEHTRIFCIANNDIVVGPKLRDYSAHDPFFTANLTPPDWPNPGLVVLKHVWSFPGVGMCAIQTDELVKLAQQETQNKDLVKQLRGGLNHLVTIGLLVPIPKEKGWYVPKL